MKITKLHVTVIAALLTTLGMLAPLSLAAQNHKSAGHGYVFAAPGAISAGGLTDSTFHVGGGGEAPVWGNLAVGAEIGWLAPASQLDGGFGVFSINPSYRFRTGKENARAIPFVTGGYSLLFRESTANAINLGGGVDYWFRDKLGLRVEVRDHIRNPRFTGPIHIWQVRVGLTFR